MMALTAAFDCIDENGDGVVDFAEWVQVCGCRHRNTTPPRAADLTHRVHPRHPLPTRLACFAQVMHFYHHPLTSFSHATKMARTLQDSKHARAKAARALSVASGRKHVGRNGATGRRTPGKRQPVPAVPPAPHSGGGASGAAGASAGAGAMAAAGGSTSNEGKAAADAVPAAPPPVQPPSVPPQPKRVAPTSAQIAARWQAAAAQAIKSRVAYVDDFDSHPADATSTGNGGAGANGAPAPSEAAAKDASVVGASSAVPGARSIRLELWELAMYRAMFVRLDANRRDVLTLEEFLHLPSVRGTTSTRAAHLH